MARKGKKRVLQSHFDWHHVCITIVALAGLAIPPLANAQPVYLPANDATKTFDPAAGSAEERSVKATKKAVNRLTERMAAFEFTDNADYNFAMVARMQRQADIDIAKIELEHGKEPMLRSMAIAAFGIIAGHCLSAPARRSANRPCSPILPRMPRSSGRADSPGT